VWASFESERAYEVTDAPFVDAPGLSDPDHGEFVNSQSLDQDLLVDLVASRSAVITLPVEERVEVLQRVRTLAPPDEPFDLDYRTHAWRSTRA
jgi:hypothetical protein